MRFFPHKICTWKWKLCTPWFQGRRKYRCFCVFWKFFFTFVNEIVNSNFCSLFNEPKNSLGVKPIFSFLWWFSFREMLKGKFRFNVGYSNFLPLRTRNSLLRWWCSYFWYKFWHLFCKMQMKTAFQFMIIDFIALKIIR